MITELQDHVRRYLHAVVDREWPRQQAGHGTNAAEPDLRRLRMTLADFKAQTPGDAVLKLEMLHG
jgi:hypothetical protein